MTENLQLGIAALRDIVAKLRDWPFPEKEAADRDALVAMLEQQIREMERERQGAWS